MRYWPRIAAFGVIGVMVAAVSALLAVGLLDREPVTGRSGVTRVGKPAEPFTLPLFDGGEFVLAAQRGRPVVINFWASWCPPCREEAPLLESVWRLYGEREVAFVGVNIQDAVEEAAAYLAEFDITYPNGMDADGRITIDYGVIGLPVTFFIDRDGMVRRRWVGPIGEAELLSRVDELVTGAPVPKESADGNLDELYRLE